MSKFRNCPVWLGAFLLVEGCTGKGTLRVEGKIAETSAALSPEQGAPLELGDGALVVESARVAVSEIELEGGRRDQREAELGAAVIDLALDGTPTPVAVDSVEAGSYHTLGLELRTGGPAIVVEGTFDGAPFTHSSGLSPELEFALHPEVNVPSSGEATVGIVFDVATWFVADDGSLLDPSAAAHRDAIEARILATMAARAEIEQADDGD
jgi:hypothetical protein